MFQIIRDNSGPGLKPSELLPSRLADNQLHRYSRVLQSNLGNVFRYISIFGFSDNLTMLVSDDVGVGQFHLSRSLFAIVMVAILGKLLGL